MNTPSPEQPPTDLTGEPVRLEGFGPQDLYQKREKIFTRAIRGFYQRLRLFTGWPLLIGYFGLPWLNYAGRQAVLFDLPARQFHIFGMSIWPQDLWLLGWLLMISAFALFAVTTMVGRLWCGYTCPQTVWTAIFMWIEQFAEGARHQRIRLNDAPWSVAKWRKRALKHGMWLGWAFLTGLTFVGYFTPIRELAMNIAGLNLLSVDPSILFWVVFFTFATYINAGWLREQVCIYMCPYARFQSAMIDADTLTVSYDATRGEPRGARKRGADPQATGLGSCIDCQLCVQVCPTGIDIRNGLQYECIGCAHCIDACNQVMGQMNYPTGLVRYASERELQGGKLHIFRPRSVAYAGATFALCIAFGAALYSRAPLSMDIIRERGALFQVDTNGRIQNNYQLKVMNKSQTAQRIELSVAAPADANEDVHIDTATSALIPAGAVVDLPLRLVADRGLRAQHKVTLNLCEASNGNCVSEQTTFFKPAPQPVKAPR